jgi:hypothetical protein
MSFLFTLDEDKLSEQLPEIFAKAEREILKAEPLFEIEGQRLELLMRNLPQHQGHYAQKAQEMKQLMKWLENYKAKLEFIHLKNYSRGQRALSATDQRVFLGGEQNVIEVNQLIIEANLMYSKFDEITEAFKQLGWMLGNITKLRVAELHEVII